VKEREKVKAEERRKIRKKKK